MIYQEQLWVHRKKVQSHNTTDENNDNNLEHSKGTERETCIRKKKSLCCLIYLYLYLSAPVCLSLYPSTHPSIHPSTHPPIYLSIYVLVRPSVRLSISILTHLYLFFCLYTSADICPTSLVEFKYLIMQSVNYLLSICLFCELLRHNVNLQTRSVQHLNVRTNKVSKCFLLSTLLETCS